MDIDSSLEEFETKEITITILIVEYLPEDDESASGESIDEGGVLLEDSSNEEGEFSFRSDMISEVRIKELETGLRAYLAKQLTTVETAIVTAIVTAHGAFIRALMISHVGHCHLHPLYVLKNMFFLHELQAFAGGPLVQARNFVVMTGTNAGISCVMKRIRGVEDMHSSMVAAFGSGAMFSLVSGIGGSNQAVNAVTSGLFFALIQGGFFIESERFTKPPADDMFYSRTKGMLTCLGLQNYEKNFKKGIFNDATLPLLTDSALRDVNIPPGPRLLILDHIQRNRDLV
ncbi:chloroplastic import inner membrane translocase subunit HP30-2-like [Zingiber officinale]|uniref:chloroplastic import inner membrane translocase subunit HP30-2-like n=1 Tax=Zingiber officinale TaxID=94328 RepID=UPI001C4BEFCE|nr:chloroplastic import inner membrane translocase subunit HP30-2-like [Zingiber officinale]